MDRSPAAALLLALLTAFVSAQPGVPPLDPGGVSLDFTGLGRTEVVGPNLLRNSGMEQIDADGTLGGWEADSYVWLATADPAQQAAIERRAVPLMRWVVTTEQPSAGRRAARLVIPQPAYSAEYPPGHEFCAMYHQRVGLPELSAATKYRLGYQQRGRSATGMPNCRAYTRITFYDDTDPTKARQTRVYAQRIFSPTEEWHEGELVFVAPPETRCLDVRIALTGVGDVQFDEVVLQQAEEQEASLAARLMPWGLVDELYCLSSGDVLTMIFGFRNGDDREINQPQLVLELPDFVGVLDTSPTAELLEQTDLPDDLTRHRYDLTPLKNQIRGSDFAYPFNQWNGLSLFVRTDHLADSTLHSASYWLEDGDYRSEPRGFSIRIDPPLPEVDGPRLFRSGAHPFRIWAASAPEAVEGLGRTWERVGFNCVHCPPGAIGDDLGSRGIERYTQPFTNGFRMGARAPGTKPDDAVFRTIDGEPLWEAICPTEVYRRGAYFRNAIVDDTLRKLLVVDRRADQLMCNWEPHMYVGRGCYCDRCRQEFVSWSKLPAAEVDGVWPRTVAQTHLDLLQEFRSWQHGQLMRTIQQTAEELGEEAGREINFIPELYHGLLTSHGAALVESPELRVSAYLDSLRAVNAWAPYNWYVFGRSPYEYVRGLHLNIYSTSTEVQEHLRDTLPADRQPRLFAFPYGTYEGVTEPEATAFEMLTYFVNGYDGTIVYLFPGGYDARHWRAMADANRQMAMAETFVMEGRSVRDHAIEPVSPMPLPDPRFLNGAGACANRERWEKTSMLQSWEFERDGRRMIAVGNFWERAECFFRLTARVPEGRCVLREPLAGRAYGPAGGGAALTRGDLAEGVLLHVGALRYAWFVLEPYDASAEYGALIAPREMREVMEDRMPSINEAGPGTEECQPWTRQACSPAEPVAITPTASRR